MRYYPSISSSNEATSAPWARSTASSAKPSPARDSAGYLPHHPTRRTEGFRFDQPAQRDSRFDDSHSEKSGSVGHLLRLGGLVLVGSAVAAIYALVHLVHAEGRHSGDVLGFLLALAGFAGASFGSILLFLGDHIFDEMEISERWRRRDYGPQ